MPFSARRVSGSRSGPRARPLDEGAQPSPHQRARAGGVAGKDLYLIDPLRRRMEYPELKREVRAQYERFRPNVVLIEDKASGTQLIQEQIGRASCRERV